MFPRSYFPDGFFSPDYWAKVGASATGGRGPTVAGKPHMAALMRTIAVQEYNRSLLDEESMRAVRMAVAKRAAVGAWLRKIEADYQQKCLEWAAYSVVLSEV